MIVWRLPIGEIAPYTQSSATLTTLNFRVESAVYCRLYRYNNQWNNLVIAWIQTDQSYLYPKQLVCFHYSFITKSSCQNITFVPQLLSLMEQNACKHIVQNPPVMTIDKNLILVNGDDECCWVFVEPGQTLFSVFTGPDYNKGKRWGKITVATVLFVTSKIICHC